MDLYAVYCCKSVPNRIWNGIDNDVERFVLMSESFNFYAFVRIRKDNFVYGNFSTEKLFFIYLANYSTIETKSFLKQLFYWIKWN